MSRGASIRFILDDGPLDLLASVVETSELSTWPADSFLIASSTYRASLKHSFQRLRLLEALNGNGEKIFEVFTVQVGGDDPAGEIFLELHSDVTVTKDKAEREAISWAQVHGPEAVFVTWDKRASLSALAELGRGRVAHSFDVWLELEHLDRVSTDQFRELCERTRNHDRDGLERMPGRVTERFA